VRIWLMVLLALFWPRAGFSAGYTAVLLSGDTGFSSSEALGVNSRGEVAGDAFDFPSGGVGFVWSAQSGYRYLTANDSYSQTWGSGITDEGVAVGGAVPVDGGSDRPFAWMPDGSSLEVPQPDPSYFSSLTAINPAGLAVGGSTIWNLGTSPSSVVTHLTDGQILGIGPSGA